VGAGGGPPPPRPRRPPPPPPRAGPPEARKPEVSDKKAHSLNLAVQVADVRPLDMGGMGMFVLSGEVMLAFGAASLVTMLLPGPAVVYVVTRSIEHGRVAGLCSMAGLETGAALHVLLSMTGVAALLQASAVAFTVLTWVGAGYLFWLGARALLVRDSLRADEGTAVPPRRRRFFVDGLLVDLLNPKTALFFLAFLPQFVNPSRGSVSLQVAVLGVIFVLIAGLCDSTYAILASRMSRRLRSSTRARRRLGLATGGVYLSLALVAVTI
jgi:threonine/homoserine/homoserine lactone efflux protein